MEGLDWVDSREGCFVIPHSLSIVSFFFCQSCIGGATRGTACIYTQMHDGRRAASALCSVADFFLKSESFNRPMVSI